jgi:anti-sigma factor RsiW
MPSDDEPPDDEARWSAAAPHPHQAEFAELIGFTLGNVSDAETGAVRSHLAECTLCPPELAGLERTIGMLGQVPPEAFLDGPPDQGELLVQRTLRAIRADQAGLVAAAPVAAASSAARTVGLIPHPAAGRRSSPRLIAAAVAAVLAVGGAGVISGRLTAGGDSPRAVATVTAEPSQTPVPGTKVASATNPATGAHVSVTVIPAEGWVRVDAAAAGLPAGDRCRLVVVDRAGGTTVAGSWLVPAPSVQPSTVLQGLALVDPAQVAAVRIENDTGTVLVTAAV